MHLLSFPGSVSNHLDLAFKRQQMREVLCTETWAEFLV